MKIIKDSKTALLIKSFLLDNKDHLSVTAMHYFDLARCDEPLEEQAMWKETMAELGDVVLDMGMPKPNAEVLLSGCCHNLLVGESSSHVGVKVGSIEKELYVFGERRWEMGLISAPLPFKKIPLTYDNAFGGVSFAKNPVGKGYGERGFLPNIEDPKHLIASQNDTTDPAGFMPYDVSWPQCSEKLGTYDEKWKRELWPGFAADMDYTYFNLAPDDQQQKHYFEGGESIELTNMHPKHHFIRSTIPQTTIRCFATSIEDDEVEKFQEIVMQRDTLWLFPELQRGILVFRGTIEVSDEEYSNLKYLNLKSLQSDETPKSLDAQYALQKKELDKSTEIDSAPLQEAKGKILEAKKKIFDIPREVKEADLRASGKRPTLERTSAEKVARSHSQIDASLKRITASEEKLITLKEKFSHYAKIDTQAFASAKAKLLATKDTVTTMMANVEKTLAEADAMKLEALEKVEAVKRNPKLPDEAKDFKFDKSFLEPKVKTWSDWAFEFLSEGVKQLEKEPELLHKLRHLGLSKRTVKRSWVGFNAVATSVKASDWMLEDEVEIVLPRGLLVPRFEEAKLISLRVIDIDKLVDPDVRVIHGSDEDFEQLLCYEDEGLPLFYLTDDLQGWLCDQECYDICNTLVCDDLSTVGDRATELLEKAPVVFYLQEDGVVEKLPHAMKFDTKEYKNLFELHQNGIELREQMLENLPDSVSELFEKERDVSTKAITKKTKKIAEGIKEKLTAEGEAIKSELLADKEKAMAQAEKSIEKVNVKLKAQGLDPISLPKETPLTDSKEFMSESEVSKGFDDAIAKLKSQKIAEHHNMDDTILKLQQQKAETVARVKKANVQYEEAEVKFTDAKVKLADPIPQWAKNMMLKAGIDPSDPHKQYTRELVIADYAEAKSFAGKNLSQLDLSNLDLKGIDLKGANLQESDFSHTNLSGANLEKSIASKANFTSAILDEANISDAVFKKSVVKNVSAKQIKAVRTLFDKVDIRSSQFLNAMLSSAIFKESKINASDFSGSDFKNAPFIKSELSNSVFDDAKMHQVTFIESRVEGCQFVHLDSEKMLFNKSKVYNSNFSHSKLYNMRILKESLFDSCDLSDSNMDRSTIVEASLSKCNLQKSHANKMLIKTSKIEKCDFRAVQAKNSRFEFSQFLYCNLAGINLMNGSLRRAFLQNCDFSYANLYSVEFFKIKYHESDFSQANLKKSGLENRMEFIDD